MFQARGPLHRWRENGQRTDRVTDQMLSGWLKKLSFMYLRKMPRNICETPNTMDIFILRELRKGSSVREPFHAGSTPKGYVGPVMIRPTVAESLGGRGGGKGVEGGKRKEKERKISGFTKLVQGQEKGKGLRRMGRLI